MILVWTPFVLCATAGNEHIKTYLEIQLISMRNSFLNHFLVRTSRLEEVENFEQGKFITVTVSIYFGSYFMYVENNEMLFFLQIIFSTEGAY